jgi:hypothetical protein
MSVTLTSPLQGILDGPGTRRPFAGARTLAAGAGLWAVITGLLTLIQFGTPALVGIDGYYHLRMAQLIRTVGWLPEFRWLPLTILSPTNYYDHHFLYHLLLAPFAWGDPSLGGAAALALGGKIASILLASLAFTAVWIGLRRHVRWAGIWTLGLFALSEAFLYRMSMPRAQAVSLLLLVIGFFLLAERRDRWLLPLGFVYVWLYDAFLLLPLLAACRVAADLFIERRLDARPILYASLGIGLGLLVNPYFPRDLVFVGQHILPKLGAPGIPVGNEWYPYDTWTLVTNSGLAFVALAAALFVLGKRNGRLERATVMAMLLAFAFGLLFLKSRRFAEYFPAFSLLALAFSTSPWLGQLGDARPSLQRRIPFLMAAVLALPLAWTTWQARQTVAGSAPLDRFGPAATWLARHSQPGDLVFQTDWDDFPRLFFYNTTNVYTLGLDPTYLQLADAALYDEWVAITRGQVEAPSGAIGSRFGARFVFSDLEHTAFLERADVDPGLKEIYRDRTAVIYRVLPPTSASRSPTG